MFYYTVACCHAYYLFVVILIVYSSYHFTIIRILKIWRSTSTGVRRKDVSDDTNFKYVMLRRSIAQY
jgi:hypothetical protein